MQPIRIQVSRCVFDGVTSNLPIMRRAYVALFVLATLFSIAWRKTLYNTLSWYTIENSIRLVLISCYTHEPFEKIQPTRRIFQRFWIFHSKALPNWYVANCLSVY